MMMMIKIIILLMMMGREIEENNVFLFFLQRIWLVWQMNIVVLFGDLEEEEEVFDSI